MTNQYGFVLTVTALPSGVAILPTMTTVNLSLSQIQYPIAMGGPSFFMVLKNSTGSVMNAGIVPEDSWGPASPASFISLSVSYENNAQVYRSTGLTFTLTPSVTVSNGAILITLPPSFSVNPNTMCNIGAFSFDPANNAIQLSYVTLAAGTTYTFHIDPIIPNAGARQNSIIVVENYDDNYNIVYDTLVQRQNASIAPAGPGILNMLIF